MSEEKSLGCGKEFKMNLSTGFICGVPDGWGKETLCQDCMRKLRIKWNDEDAKNIKLQRQLGYIEW